MEENTQTEQLEKFANIEIFDNTKRAKTLITVFWILTGLTAIGILSSYFELELLKSGQLTGYIDENDANANDLRQGIIGVLQIVIYIVSIIVFLNWFRRAYGNLHKLGLRYLKQNETMAVWSWFIPILFLFRPVQIMNEIWRETQLQIKKCDSKYLIKSGGLIIGVWWALFIFSNFIGKYVLRTAFKTDTIEEVIEGTQAIMLSDIMEIPEALLVILIVSQFSKIETKFAETVNIHGGTIVSKK